MKKLFLSSIIVMLCLLFTECDKQLDLRPLGQLDELIYYQTEKDFEAASLSPYSTILNLYYMQDVSGWYATVLYPDDDIVPPNGQSNSLEDFNWTPTNGNFNNIWQTCYTGIARANIILDKLPLAKGFTDVSKKARFEGEAKFIRAYFNFLLAINFGKAPVSTTRITTIDGAKLPNSKPGELWDLIISDLNFAKSNLPPSWNSTNTGRATSGAAAAFLGKVYLYRAQWDKDNTYYAKAITELSGLTGYSLVSFSDNFDINKENNNESVFEIQFTRGDFNPWLPTDFGAEGDQNVGAAGTARTILFRPSCGPNNVCAPGANGSGYGQFQVTQTLQNEFEPNDPRRSETIYLAGDDFIGEPFQSAWSVTGSTPSKYIKGDILGGFPPNITTNDERVIRFSDVKLMLAEATLLGNNDVAGAATLINQVRRRADPSGTILADRSSGSSKDQMLKFLIHERRVELAFEGHRYFDLVRWHRAGLINIKTDIDFGRATANQNWSPKNLIKPIPQRELDLNTNLQQNDEYK